MRIAELNERSYREMLWNHRPLTDFWRVGRGYARKLEEVGIYTMEILPDVPWADRMIITMKICCIVFWV